MEEEDNSRADGRDHHNDIFYEEDHQEGERPRIILF